MANKKQSLDGIIARRETGDTSKNLVRPRVAENRAARVVVKKPVAKIDNDITKENADIDGFIKNLGYDDEQKQPAKSRGELKKEQKKNKRDRKAEKKANKRDKKGGKKRGRKIALIVTLVIVAIIGGVGAFIYKMGDDFIKDITGGEGSLWNVITADPDTPLATDSDGRTNILVFGTSDEEHDGADLSDSIMIVSIDQTKGDVKMVSLPRDLGQMTKEMGACSKTAKVNETYYCAMKNRYSPTYGDEKGSAEKFMAVAKEITGIDMQYWVHVNWEAMRKIVNAIGGVDVSVQYIGNKDTYTGELPVVWSNDQRGIKDNVINLGIGDHHLDGNMALELARSRNSGTNCSLGYASACGQYGLNGNWSRESTQQSVIEAILYKAKRTNFVTDFGAVLEVKSAVGDNLRLNFKDSEYKTLFHLASKIDIHNMQTISIQSLFSSGFLPVPGVNNRECGGTSPGCLSYVFPKAGAGNYSAIKAYIKQRLSSDPVVSEGATIDVLNGSGVSGRANITANELREAGYKIGKEGNAPNNDFNGYHIYAIDRNMSGTANALSKKYGVEVEYGAPEGVRTTADFVVIIGKQEGDS
jgi:LCP family protein required for cell wall assembly